MELPSPETHQGRVLRIAAELKYGKKDAEDEHLPFYQTSETAPYFDRCKFSTPSKEEILKLLKRKYVLKLTMLKPFVDVLKYTTSVTEVSICPISSTAKFWNIIFKNRMSVSRVIKMAQDIGLLYCVNPTYQFNGHSADYNRCRCYAYNKAIEQVLLELFKEFDIGYQYEAINTWYVISICNRFEKRKPKDRKMYMKYRDYMRNFKIRIVQQTRLPLRQEYLSYGLTKVYPQYMEMLKTIDEDNKMMESAADYDIALPSFSYNKDRECTRIGLRKTNRYCTLKVHNISWETLSEDEKKRTRREVIRSKFGEEYENDVKSSIYRITHLLNHGKWLDSSYDLYPMMAGFEMTKEERNLYKAPLAMKLYFSPSVDKAIASSVFQHSETKELFEKLEARDTLAEARKRMFDVIGPSFRSEIFLHESCIYTQVAHRLRIMGFKVIQIYDGFFTDRELEQSVFDEIVKECALKYYHRWEGHWYNWS